MNKTDILIPNETDILILKIIHDLTLRTNEQLHQIKKMDTRVGSRGRAGSNCCVLGEGH